jgi:hypothetical protein
VHSRIPVALTAKKCHEIATEYFLRTQKDGDPNVAQGVLAMKTKGAATDLHRPSAARYDRFMNAPAGPRETALPASSRHGLEGVLWERAEPLFECRPGKARPAPSITSMPVGR